MQNRFFILALVVCIGCSSFQKMGIRSVSPLLEESGNHLTEERSWEFFRQSAPANIKFLELFVLTDPKNQTLKRTLIKAYAGYAFGVPETLAYNDQLALNEETTHRKEAILHYTKALDYGVDYLHAKGITRKNLLTLDEDKLIKKLKNETSHDDLSAILYFAQAWGSLINLQKDNVALVSQIPRVKALFDFVCGEDPTLEFGVCDLFFAQYESSRPKMLGGNPEKGKELFKQAILRFPKHLLIRVNYLQFVALPSFDQEEYDQQAEILRKEFAEWENLSRDNLDDVSTYREVKQLNLYNAIAKKRFEIMEAHKNKIF